MHFKCTSVTASTFFSILCFINSFLNNAKYSRIPSIWYLQDKKGPKSANSTYKLKNAGLLNQNTTVLFNI
jgi:hypothetical protein